MQKPFEAKTLEEANRLLSTVFGQAQGKEYVYLEFGVTATWPAAASVGEKQLVLANNTIDGKVRLYTKVGDVLKYLVFT